MSVRPPTTVSLSETRGIVLDFPYDVVDVNWRRMNEAFTQVFGDDIEIDWRGERAVEIRPGVPWKMRFGCLEMVKEP